MKKIKFYDDIQKLLDDKYNLDIYDVSNSHDHFNLWRLKKGLPERDSEGNHYNSSQSFFTLYCGDPEGSASCPPYHNFWHWILHNVLDDDDWIEEPGRRGPNG